MNLFPLSWANIQQRWRSWFLVAVMTGLYVLLFLLLYPDMGASTAALSVLPVMLAAWLFGIRIGFLAALLAFPLNTLLMSLFGNTGWETLLRRDGILGTLAIIFIAIVVGGISDRLRESRESARQLADASFEAIVIHDKGVILDVNQSLCRMFGYERSEVTGMLAMQLTASEDRELVRQMIASGDTRSYECSVLRKDGTTFRVQVIGKPMTYKGRTVRVTAMRDITESLQTRDALELERSLLRTLIDDLPHRIFYKDTQGCYVVINSALARTYNLNSVDDAVGKSVFDYYPEDLAAKYHADDLAVVRSGQPLLNHEETSIDEYGNKRWLLTNKVPVRDKDQQVIGVIGIAMDITDRKQAESQRLELALAKEKTEFLKEFLGTVSHDLKTPLSIMNTTLYLLEKLTDPERQKDKLEIIKGQTLRLAKLIQDILTMSQLESVPELDLQPLDINFVLSNIESGFRGVAEEKQLTMSLKLTPALPRVLGDQESIHRIFVNLVENALNYTKAQGSITIQTSIENNNVIVDIQDTGIGVSEKDMPYIFDAFFRADEARASNTGGTGLGLAIVKKIIQMHGGSIEVKSQLGVGSTFRVQLPVLKSEFK